MQTVLITGGTGLIGTALSRLLLERDYRVIILSRREQPRKLILPGNLRFAGWNIEKGEIDGNAVAEADFIVHLAGAGISDRRWSPSRKKEILESRTRSSALLLGALQKHPGRIKAVVSAGAIGYYGHSAGKIFRESDPPSADFLGSTCSQWEASVLAMEQTGSRVVICRMGLVLGRDGGALKKWIPPLRFGFAGIPGNGEQWVSWIHLRDVSRLLYSAIANESMKGIYNGVAPAPVQMKELVNAMARAMKGRNFLPVHLPAAVVETVWGEMGAVVLQSCKASAEKLISTGFQYSFPGIESAMQEIFKPQTQHTKT